MKSLTRHRFVARGFRTLSLLALIATAPGSPAWAAGGFMNVGNMTNGRASHAAVSLADGRVLIVSDFSGETFDPVTKTFSFAGSLNEPRGAGLSATVLDDGRVLIVGGQFFETSRSSAEIYDPVAGTFTPTGSLATPRAFHTATRLLDGKVLVAGGHQFNFVNSALASAELYDPLSGTFSSVGSMGGARQDHTATLLSDGKVLVAGGYDASQLALTSVETYDPATQTFTPTGPMGAGRGNHTATSLPNGSVLVVGGHSAFPGGSLDSAEIYDPTSGSFSPTGSLAHPRGSHAAATLEDGAVLVTGGYTAFPFTGQTHSGAEIYDPAAGTFAGTGGMHAERGRHTATTLSNGDALIAGGLNIFGVLFTAEVFTPDLVDTQPPQIFVPGDQTAIASGPEGAMVFYFVSVTDDVDPNPQLDCAPASGSTFPIGTTTVACSARDAAGNAANASFHVTVMEALALTVSVDGFGSVDQHSGVATVRGMVSCNRPATANVFGRLLQVISHRAELRGFFFTSVECSSTPVPWSALVTAENGRFKSGKATVEVNASACDTFGSCDFESFQKDIQLRGR